VRILLLIISIAYLFNDLFMLFEPKLWYDVTQGVSMLGPCNIEFCGQFVGEKGDYYDIADGLLQKSAE